MTSQMVGRIMISVSKFLLFSTKHFMPMIKACKIWGRVLFLYVFVCSQGMSLYDVTSCLVAWSHIPSKGSLSLVQYYFWGDLCLEGSLPGEGGSVSEGLCQVNPCSIKSGWYASYWNAFLFCHCVVSCLSF